MTAYVVNSDSGTVTPIATATNTAGPPITVGSEPSALAITPDGKTAYVTDSGSDTVVPIATATNTPGTPISVEPEFEPSVIAITPDGKTAYVGNVFEPTVTPIATATNAANPPIAVNGLPGDSPAAIAITPNGKTVYVGTCCSTGVGAVFPVETATNTAESPLTMGDPENMVITPDGKTVYVSNSSCCAATVTPITTASNTADAPITAGSLGTEAGDIAITPNGQTVYVLVTDDNDNSGTAIPIDTATDTAGSPITVGSLPFAIAITPDGKTAYVSNYGSGTVTPITIATNTAGPPIKVGDEPEAIAITPDGKTAYVSNYGSGTVTPITIATNTAGPPITVGSKPEAIAITPVTGVGGLAPTFTSGPAATAAFGVPFSFKLTTTGSPAAKITRTGQLPSGLRFTNHGSGNANISGTPASSAAGVWPLTLIARNKNGTAIQAFILTVTRTPAIARIPTIRARVGTRLHITIRTAGYPVPMLTESGQLPDGLSYTDKADGTAVIAGTLADGSRGYYPFVITATNVFGTVSRHFTVVVFRRRKG